MDFALREWPTVSVVAAAAAIAALLCGGSTVMSDPGYLDSAKMLDEDSELFRFVALNGVALF